MQVKSSVKKTNLTSSIERVYLARHPNRPKALEVLRHICTNFEQLHGDRLYGDDPALTCGICEIGEKKVVILAQEKGEDTKTRSKHNYGMMLPEGYRKALRLIKLASKFHLPVVSIIDTPGAYPGIDAERRGQARAIANNLFEISGIKTPIISLILSEGCSGGALGIAVADKVLMLEHAYYSVISPEGCAAILWNDSLKSGVAADQLKMQSEDLLSFSMIDIIINEGRGGFHENKGMVYAQIKKEIIAAIEELESTPIDRLMDNRAKKYRSF